MKKKIIIFQDEQVRLLPVDLVDVYSRIFQHAENLEKMEKEKNKKERNDEK